MLLFRRGGNLRAAKRPWALGAWATAVLLLHAWVWLGWRSGLDWGGTAPPPRLQVQLQQIKPLKAPEPGERQLVGKRLAQPPESRRAEPAADLPLDPWDAGKDILPAPARPPEPAPSPLPDPAGEVSEDGVGPEWPLSSRLVYRVTGHYQGPVHGDAEVEWLRQGARYQVRLKLSIGPSLAPFAVRELVSDGEITPEGIAPRRYDESTRMLLGPTRQLTLHMTPTTLRLANGHTVPAPPGTQDSASQFVHLAWVLLTGRVPLEQRQIIELPLAFPGGVHPWRYEVVDRVRLESVLGPLDTWHLRPVGVAVPGALSAEVWLMPDMDFLPLQIHITQNADTWVRLELAEPPLQEAAPQNAASQPGPAAR